MNRVNDKIFTVTAAAYFSGIDGTPCRNFISPFIIILFHCHDEAFSAASHMHTPFHVLIYIGPYSMKNAMTRNIAPAPYHNRSSGQMNLIQSVYLILAIASAAMK